jgi:4-oxalomesaconate tautomerase
VFDDIAGSSCGALLPTGRAVDRIEGVDATLIDNGMPVIVLRAADLGVSGTESREQLDANDALKRRLEAIRLAAGPLMRLGEVRNKSVPKLTLVSAPARGGVLSTRSFIPHRCHASIGVFGAVTVASAAVLPGSVASGLARIPPGSRKQMLVEHPSGATRVVVDTDASGSIVSAGVVLTARKLFDGVVFGREGPWHQGASGF